MHLEDNINSVILCIEKLFFHKLNRSFTHEDNHTCYVNPGNIAEYKNVKNYA